jgi:pimeloyl-ACP methyl ester carboxylesterase
MKSYIEVSNIKVSKSMRRALAVFPMMALHGLLAVSTVFPVRAQAAASDNTIVSRNATVEGVALHYLTAGHGPTVVLIHGYAETSRMWRPLILKLAERFTVIAPDLPGIGDSAIPADGLDMKTAAIHIHALARSLGAQNAEVVGHDIGLMVAYAYAAQFPAEVTKLVVMDAFLPGMAGWEAVYNNPAIWHFRFNGPTPKPSCRAASALTSNISGTTSRPIRRTQSPNRIDGRTRKPTPSRDACAQGGPTSFPSSRPPWISLSSLKPSSPCRSCRSGEKANGDALAHQMKQVASDVTLVVLKDTGHWVMEERPQETMAALVRFL